MQNKIPKLKIEQFKNELELLYKFPDSKKSFTEVEIFDWVAECVVFFTKINVNSEIISGFMKNFELEIRSLNRQAYNYFGPFKTELFCGMVTSDYVFSKKEKWGYVKIALEVAKSILKKGLEDEKIVPNFLVNSLKSKEGFEHIISSTELIEIAYENKDSDGLIINSNTLLDSIIDLEPNLKNSGKKLGGKLGTLLEKDNENILKKFGVDSDIIRALNNSRVIRNIKSVHKDKPIKYNIPLLVAISYAYLVIMFLEITMSTGELIK